MLIKTDTYLKFMLLVLFLMGVQLAPGFSVVPLSDVVRIGLVSFFLLLAIYTAGGRIQPVSKPNLLLISLLFLFYLWAVFTSIADGQYVFDSFRRATLAIGTSLVVLSAFMFYRPSSALMLRVFWLMLIVATGISAVSLVMSFLGGGYTPTGTGQHYQSLSLPGVELTQIVHFAGGFPRISGITPNPNTLGFYSGVACVLVVALYFLKQKGFLFLLPIFLINFGALLHSFSRAAMLAFLIASVLVLFFSGRSRFLITTFISIVVVFLLLILFGDAFQVFLSSRSEQGLSGRDNIWQTAFSAFLASPIYGVGFGLEMEKIMDPADIRWTMHNAYIAVLAETGFIGFGLILFFLLLSFLIIFHKLKYTSCRQTRVVFIIILAVLLFISIRSFFETAIFRFSYINLIFISFIGMAVFLQTNRCCIDNR